MSEFEKMNDELYYFNNVANAKFSENRYMETYYEKDEGTNDIQEMASAFMKDVEEKKDFETHVCLDESGMEKFFVFKNKKTNELSVLMPPLSRYGDLPSDTDYMKGYFYEKLGSLVEKDTKVNFMLPEIVNGNHWILNVEEEQNKETISKREINSFENGRQTDGFSCGIHTLQAATSLVVDGEKSPFSSKNYNEYKKKNGLSKFRFALKIFSNKFRKVVKTVFSKEYRERASGQKEELKLSKDILALLRKEQSPAVQQPTVATPLVQVSLTQKDLPSLEAENGMEREVMEMSNQIVTPEKREEVSNLQKLNGNALLNLANRELGVESQGIVK